MENKKIRVYNRSASNVGYSIPELGIKRQFGRPTSKGFTYKDISMEELEALSMARGGLKLIQKYLIIADKDAVRKILGEVEPEYYYTIPEIKKALTSFSLDEFKDMLDFAPTGVLDIVKDLAVETELNDMNKRKAISDALGVDISNAIEIKNSAFDGEQSAPVGSKQRRAAAPVVDSEATPVRRIIKKVESE